MKVNNPLVRTWFHRWTMSYVLIFLIIVPLLIFSLLIAFNDVSQRTAAESNRIFAEQLLQSLENEFKLIDNVVSNEIAADDTMMDFFKKALGEERFYSSVMPGVKLKNMITAMPLIESIYLYRTYDGTVLTPLSITPIDQFSDKQVIIEALAGPSLNRPWTNIRKGFSELEPRELISLVRYTPLFTGTDGVIVVNVRAESVVKLVQSLTTSIENNRVTLYDREGNTIFSDTRESGFLKTESKSDYLGWTIRNGVANGNLFGIVSALSKYWIMICIAFCLLGMIGIVLVSRKNFKPVKSIVDRIQHYTEKKSAELFRKDSQDEFKFIDSALENLLELADAYQKQHEENLFYRRKTFFQEWLEGERQLKPAEWQREMQSLMLASDFGALVVSVIKINKYSKFISTYSRQDQNLLKFVLSNVVKETAETGTFATWAEWMTNEQLAVVHMVPQSAPDGGVAAVSVKQWADDLIRWVNQHLHFTVSVGIGSGVEDASLAHESYGDALEALAYMPSLGTEPVVGYWQVEAMNRLKTSNPLRSIRELAIAFRTGEGSWERSFDRMFCDIRGGLYSREEMSNLVGYMIFFLEKELMELPPELSDVWSKEGTVRLEQAANQWETLNELEKELRDIISAMADAMADIRMIRGNYRLVQDMKAYLEKHYDNPDLSLQHLSESFGLHVKTISRLFKEEVGVNFIDQLSYIRIERAKELLFSTDESIQEITNRIGYLHPNTFIRSFKKQTGQTPGDFRKQLQARV
ncbi:helix-turn-helix domain-containing protein [Paenibacillus sedimenti]|uniref:Helix-turn-helix domain-containing protein n=1 Tax=Paenibacillus sedimenti TaxID=2770274 RepID=A0A926QGK4_9BACL|nr:helix-turn-helix domain-containing protein [Paenibacillus sedimenti]MBD0378550.1 helix-turn-helix domain-containing protein [Paenibacillus sedimenti]